MYKSYNMLVLDLCVVERKCVMEQNALELFYAQKRLVAIFHNFQLFVHIACLRCDTDTRPLRPP